MSAPDASPAPTQKTIVLITGGNSGIGFDTAARLATASHSSDSSSPRYHVVLASRSLEKGRAAVDAIIQSRKGANVGPITLLQLNVTDPSSIAAAAETVAAAPDLGRVDVLVNNAGIYPDPDRPPSSDIDAFARVASETFATNSIGPALVTAAFLPLLRKSANPRVVYVSSSMGSVSLCAAERGEAPTALAYRMSKAALNMLAAYHHREFAPWRCKVWSFDPGFVVTNILGPENRERAAAEGASSSETSAEAIEAIVVGQRDADVGKLIHRAGVHEW